MYSFATPPIKLKLGQQIGGGLLIANHQDQSFIMMSQSETLSQQLDHIYYTLFLLVHSAAAAPFTSRSNMCNCAFHKPQQHVQLC